MSLLEAYFIVVETRNCPFYEENDEFQLSVNVLHMPPGKPTCTILIDDIKARFNAEQEDAPHGTDTDNSFWCSGCTGAIKLSYEKGTEYVFELEDPHDNARDNIARLLRNFSFFKTLKKNEVKHLVAFIRHREFAKGETIIQKGESGKNLYIILSGMVEVVGENDVNIAFLGKEEILGEMSLISGDAAGATIKAVEPTKVIYLNSRNFRRLLRKFPSLQMYFASLLSKRLSRTNTARTEELKSGMSGNLSEMPPSELLQTFNMNRKTGVLTFKFPHETATITFKEGESIRATFGDLKNREAFWAVLRETTGRFKFTPGLPPDDASRSEIGQFMWLLMEGLSRMDEEAHGEGKSNAAAQ
ncbi:MAG: cyclic nucleotide-binding domain-containing protein [Thermodesulfobacteriota bacterium]|nr:cyclic nucleotide-binding domain-containing protein [Thermodesulfobacteriota bacterium]